MKTTTIQPTKEELQLLQIKREQNALTLKEAKIKQEVHRQETIDREKKRGETLLKETNRKNDAVLELIYNLSDYAGKGIYQVVKEDKHVTLKASGYPLKQDIEGRVSNNYDVNEEVFFTEKVDYQEHHIKHIKSGKTIYPFLEKNTVVFRPNGSSYGRSYTRAKKLDEIISGEYDRKVNEQRREVTDKKEQELLYNMCQREYPQAVSITRTNEAIYNYSGKRYNNGKEFAGYRLLVQVVFKSGLIINCTYNKPIDEDEKPSINIYSRDLSKLGTEEILKHFGK